MNARDGTPNTEAPDSRRTAARALVAEVQAWGKNGSELPETEEVATATDRLNSYGADLRDAVNAQCVDLSTESEPYRSAQAILGEASRRLGQPALGAGAEAVVRRAQNLARLVDGLLRALEAEADTAGRHHNTLISGGPCPSSPRTSP
ncbi:DUF6415 family natural product biosynthesis protein [Streptomyces sp. SAS_281]|uniref:DUF6415 family natural product biosynthesis protein n=1 Tax=Streptomyces sp. SAS_281 TaxID=3412744 RepID=UPI00403C92D9